MANTSKNKKSDKTKVGSFPLKYKVVLALAVIVGIVTFLFAGFDVTNVNYSSDLNQYNSAEVENYFKYKKVGSTLGFVLKDKLGFKTKMQLFEKYSVNLESLTQVKIVGQEKKLIGCIEENGMFYYLDQDGYVTKQTTQKMDVPVIVGMKVTSKKLYSPLQTEDKGNVEALSKMYQAASKYNYEIRKMRVNKNNETSIYVKRLRVDLGTNTNIDKKLIALNDMHKTAFEREGILDMKHYNPDGEYTLKSIEKKVTKKDKSAKNKKTKKNVGNNQSQ